MELSDEARAEFKEAIRILREDGLHIHKTFARFQASQNNPPKDKPADNPPKDKPEDNPPPVKDPPEPAPPKGDWWFGSRGNRA